MAKPFDHERLNVYREAVLFSGWAGEIIDALPAKLAAKDQLDRASTSIPLNIAEGNGKRSNADRCRYFDIARGSTLECSACIDVLVARKRLNADQAEVGKSMLMEIVSMIAGLISRFSPDAAEKDKD